MEAKTTLDELISEELLIDYGFHSNPRGTFSEIGIDLAYYVNRGVMMFYNEEQKDVYLAGFGEMRRGKYNVVTSRWIKSESELKLFYKALTGSELSINKEITNNK